MQLKQKKVMMAKQINKVKLAITKKCNLVCNYCFVKRSNEEMNFDTAKAAVNLLLNSKGKNKLLSIYGGEPLLNFKLIRKISPYAIARARKLEKNLTISVCTNATLLTKGQLLFLSKNNIKLIISMVGKKEYHDRLRRFHSGGTYDQIKKKLPLIFKIMHPDNVGVSFCVFPSTINALEENFNHLLALKFTYINFEIIREYKVWSLKQVKKFAFIFEKIAKAIIFEATKGRFVFLNPINWEIKHRLISKSLKTTCPFNYKFEVYPKGDIAFSPFLLNSPSREDYVVGNINDPAMKRFNNCQFNIRSSRCRVCEQDYFSGYDSDLGASRVYKLYHIICFKMVQDIQAYPHVSKIFQGYIRKIRKEVCF